MGYYRVQHGILPSDSSASYVGLCNNLEKAWWRHQLETFSALMVFVRGIHRSPVDSRHKGPWRGGVLMFCLICAWTNGWANNRDADIRDAITRYWFGWSHAYQFFLYLIFIRFFSRHNRYQPILDNAILSYLHGNNYHIDVLHARVACGTIKCNLIIQLPHTSWFSWKVILLHYVEQFHENFPSVDNYDM